MLCSGVPITVACNVTQPAAAATYWWSDSSTGAIKSIQSSGLFWVKTVGACETIYDSITVVVIPSLHLDLGKDTTSCGSQPVSIGSEISGALNYRWEDGPSTAIRPVVQSGTYILSVSNQCQTLRDSITVKLIDPDQFVVPNVVTANGDK